MKTLRLAVIGAGHLGRFHARLLQGAEGVELVGIADPVEAARQNVATECKTEAFADYRALIGRIDGAVVATPTRLHHAVAMELLRHGVHLLIEKPITATLAHAEELVATAQKHGAILQVGHIERFNPALVQVQPHIQAPKFIEARRHSGYTFRSTDIGVVFDLMIHDVDVVLSLVRSPVKQVEALGVSVMGGHEDAAHARLSFENGCVANLSASRVSYQAARQMHVWSQRGFVSVDFATRGAAVVGLAPEISERRFNGDALPVERKTHLKDHLFEDLLPLSRFDCAATNALADELADFARSIRTLSPPRVTGEDGRDAVAVATQILSSIEAHAWDGHAAGPVGPLALQPHPILRGPHSAHVEQPQETRRAS